MDIWQTSQIAIYVKQSGMNWTYISLVLILLLHVTRNIYEKWCVLYNW